MTDPALRTIRCTFASMLLLYHFLARLGTSPAETVVMGGADRQAGRGLSQATRSPRAVAAATALKKRTLTNFYNARPQCLSAAHARLDAAVAAAHGGDAAISEGDTLPHYCSSTYDRYFCEWAWDESS